jgi:hypothetical protein
MTSPPRRYASLTRTELTAEARRLGLKGYSKLTKAELLQLLEAQRSDPSVSTSRPAEIAGSVSADARPIEHTAPSPVLSAAPAAFCSPVAPTAPVVPVPVPERRLSTRARADRAEGEYRNNRIVLLPKDPQQFYCYWELAESYKAAARAAGGQALYLRLYDLSDLDPDGTPKRIYEIACPDDVLYRYFPVPTPGHHYRVEVGFRGEWQWLPMARSNIIAAPQAQVSTSEGAAYLAIPLDQTLAQLRPELRDQPGALGNAPNRSRSVSGILTPVPGIIGGEAIYLEEHLSGSERPARPLPGHLPGSHIPGSHVPGSSKPERPR